MSEADITLQGIAVGKIILNPKEIQGVGGWHNPLLHVPIKIQLYPTKREEQIALIRLTASLHLAEHPSYINQFGAKVSYDQINNLPLASNTFGTAPSEGGIQLLFSLSHEHIKQLEDLRHEMNSNLYLHIEPIITHLLQTEQAYLTLGDQRRGIGQQSNLAFLWQAAIGILRIETAEMKWAENIFPGIGYDRFRLIEIALPSSSRLVPNDAIEMFEKAMHDYDVANYNGCVEKCRFTIEAIERHLSVPNGHKLGDAVAETLGWSTGSEQCNFLNQACKAYYSLTSAAHHYPSTISLLPADAHTSLLVTATLLEYLGQLR